MPRDAAKLPMSRLDTCPGLEIWLELPLLQLLLAVTATALRLLLTLTLASDVNGLLWFKHPLWARMLHRLIVRP